MLTIIQIALYGVVIPCSNTVTCMLAMRIWLLYYDMNVSKLLLQKVWRSVIDPEFKNWFFQKQNTLGDAKYLLKFGIIFVIVICSLIAVLRFTVDKLIERMISWLTLSVSPIFAIVIYLKLKHFYYDNLGIRREFFYFFMLVLIFITLNIILALIDGLIYTMSQSLFDLFWIFFTIILSNGIMFIMVPLSKKLSHPTMISTKLPKDFSMKLVIQKSIENHKNMRNSQRNLGNGNREMSGPQSQDSSMYNNVDSIPDSAQLPSLRMQQYSSQGSSNTYTSATTGPHSGPGSGPGSGAATSAASSLPMTDENSVWSTSASGMGMFSGYGSGSGSSGTKQSKAAEKYNHWSKIVITPFGYESFMNHLGREFAIENLLFISEVCRFVWYAIVLLCYFFWKTSLLYMCNEKIGVTSKTFFILFCLKFFVVFCCFLDYSNF